MSNQIKTSSEKENKIQEFFKEKFYVSFSSLSKLLTDPKQFYKEYILGEYDDSDTKVLKQGELLHCFVLEPENFDDKFVVMPAKVPGGGLKIVIDTVYKTYVPDWMEQHPGQVPILEDFKQQILDELVEQDLYQTLTDAKRKDVNGNLLTADEKRIEKCITEITRAYFAALVESGRKTIVDLDMVAKSRAKADAILSNTKVQHLISGEQIDRDVRKEMKLDCELPGYPFGLKGILDCVVIDYKNATIYITDLKTTSKELKDFQESVEKYKYWLQAVIYKELVISLIPKDNDEPWTLKFNFLVIDKTNSVYAFPVSPDSLRKWEMETKKELNKAKWHFENQKFDLPYDYEHGLVEL
jgi:hypothetical protein